MRTFTEILRDQLARKLAKPSDNLMLATLDMTSRIADSWDVRPGQEFRPLAVSVPVAKRED